MMEMPKYQWPRISDVAIGIWQRALAFLQRAGTIILFTTVLLWVLASFPDAPDGVKQSEYSIAGRIANGIEVVVKPIGFNHDIALALIPAMAAREVAVSAIATVYAIDAASSWRSGCRARGRCRRRSPSSHGSCSHRSAFPRSPSRGARPTAGSGRA
jgi:Fe2+ transport system protein B